MPALSLVVCIYGQRDLLERLLRKSSGCYDELLVVHDGPDNQNVRSLVESHHGRFIENVRHGSLEGQSPFAWAQARHEWILRLDADEFPGDEMIDWLRRFRTLPDPDPGLSGFTCIWPLWNGQKAISKKCWPGRIFLFDRRRVRFFGLVEQGVIPDGRYEPLDMILHHQPNRKSYGFKNVLIRKQAYHWRAIIAQSLLGKPTDLPCWRWEKETWPPEWEQIRRRPLRTACHRLIMGIFRGLRGSWRAERKLFIEAAFNGPIHHALICLKYWQLQRRRRLKKSATS